MNTLKKIVYISILTLLILPSCKYTKQPWNPIFEETHFFYFENSVKQALSEINDAERNFKTDRDQEGYESLGKAKQIFLALKGYYIPLTEVRQIIYDADRFFHLKSIDEAKKHLEEARKILFKMDQYSESEGFDNALEKLTIMTDECLFSLEEKSENSYEKFKILANEVNLMLVKGELVLSNVTFD